MCERVFKDLQVGTRKDSFWNDNILKRKILVSLMKYNYMDLKEGDSLTVNPGGLEIRVLGLENGTLKLIASNRRIAICKGSRSKLSGQVDMHNYGSRGRGNRLHVRLDFLYDNLEYEKDFVIRESTARKNSIARNLK